jgi:hypothetical protein
MCMVRSGRGQGSRRIITGLSWFELSALRLEPQPSSRQPHFRSLGQRLGRAEVAVSRDAPLPSRRVWLHGLDALRVYGWLAQARAATIRIEFLDDKLHARSRSTPHANIGRAQLIASILPVPTCTHGPLPSASKHAVTCRRCCYIPHTLALAQA